MPKFRPGQIQYVEHEDVGPFREGILGAKEITHLHLPILADSYLALLGSGFGKVSSSPHPLRVVYKEGKALTFKEKQQPENTRNSYPSLVSENSLHSALIF
jgi:hypothetical protein